MFFFFSLVLRVLESRVSVFYLSHVLWVDANGQAKAKQSEIIVCVFRCRSAIPLFVSMECES